MAKRLLLSCLLLSCLLFSMQAQTNSFTISGQVTTGDIGFPFFEPIIATSEDGNYSLDGIPNEEGFYSITFELEEDYASTFIVEAFDFCTGDLLYELVNSADGDATVNFDVCGDWEPTDPEDCSAYYDFAQEDPDNPLVVSFYDASYGDIDSWTWDFGDGTTSNEQNPIHTYDPEGIYEVSLTVSSSADDCTGTIIMPICIYENNGPIDCECTDEWAPVCVQVFEDFIIEFPNACWAECEGFGEDTFVDCDWEGCGCDTNYDPVCVINEVGDIITYSNECLALCAGSDPALFVDCDEPGECECPVDIYDPVCIATPFYPFTIEFPNACVAECEGFSPDIFIDCDIIVDCLCDDIYDPVCVWNDAWELQTFENECVAICAGYNPADFVECEPTNCDCDDVYDPVCVNFFGIIITVENECVALCQGFTPDMFVDCDPDGCGCEAYFGPPVCVVLEDGTIYTMENACYAECEGYTDYYYCDDVPPGDECWTYIDYAQEDPDNPLVVSFYGITESNEELTWVWDFGDGTTSNEQNPIHTYDPEGIYDVTLTVSSELCNYTTSFLICVYEDNGPIICDCSEEYDPVCVEIFEGLIVEYPNACWAECDGFGEDLFVDCEWDPCECYDLYDPVCVAGFAGIIEFQNECFALCEGFTPNDFVDCEDNCNCTDEYDPVCVTVLGSPFPLTFPNACHAECAGFTPDMFVECDPDACGCESYFGPPVCVVLEDGTIYTMENACYAECEGYTDYYYCDDVPPIDECWAYIDYAQEDADNPLVVSFYGIAESNEELTWAWDFGDGTTSNEQNPVHTYDPEGIYDVTLTVSSENCSSTTTILICVYEDNGPIDCECTEEYDPVCVEFFEGLIIEYPNACWAECDGFGEDSFVDCEWDECECYDLYDPVCVLDQNGNILSFSNECYALCEGYDVFVDCEDECNCPEIYDPVCVVGFAGIIEYQNECFALCDGFTPNMFVDCEDECICTDEWDPVCVVTDDGIFYQFSNLCEAECVGFGADQVIDCENDCNCTEEYDPVCVEFPDSPFPIEFPNACHAECAGFTPDFFVDCSDIPPYEDCNCDEELDPVCAILEGDIVIPFPNACIAECYGFTEFADECDDPFGFTNDPNTIYEYLEILETVTSLWESYGSQFVMPEFAPELQGHEVASLLTVYPNPVQDELNIVFNTTTSGKYTLNIVSITGQTLYSVIHEMNKGQNTVSVPVDRFSEGIYFAQLKSKDNLYSTKFVK